MDLQYALRTLVKSPGFTAAAVLSLALGIGANTAIFTLTNAVFLNPLPVDQPSRVLELYTVDHLTSTAGNLGRTAMSYPNYEDLRDHNQVFSSLAAFINTGVTITGQGAPKPQAADLVSPNYFDVLGVKPALGRTFFADEAAPVAILSYSTWQSRFGGDGAALGRTIELNSTPYTIVGVAPPEFKGTFSVGNPDVIWIPMGMHQQALPGGLEGFFRERRMRMINVFGRLKPEVNEQQALANLQTIAAQLEREYPAANRGRTLEVSSLSESTLGGQRGQAVRFTFALTLVVGLVLLIACVNLANLLLARSAKRAREMGIRTALGASRKRLIRQLLTESLLLSVTGGVGGLFVGWLGSRLLWSFRPVALDPNSVALRVDARVFVFTAAIALLTGLLFGLAPAIQASSPDLNSILKSGGRGGTESWGRNRLRQFLVVAQIALAMVALIGAGLFIRSMRNAERENLGFETQKLFLFQFDLAARHYSPARGREFQRSVIAEVESTPGVSAAAITSAPPLIGGLLATTFTEGQEDPLKARGILTLVNSVTPGYFDTLRIPVQEGRLFSDLDRDGTRRVAVVSLAMARRFWPGQNVIGRRFRFFNEIAYREVVGVVADISALGTGAPPQPIAYLPMEQSYQTGVGVVVRTVAKPGLVLKPVLAKVQLLDPDLSLAGALTMPELIERGLWAPRTGAALFGLFGLLGMVLAAMGIYGVMAYIVAQRSGEIGVRMALGARPADVLRLVVGQGARLVLTGIAVGAIVALALSRLMSGLLFGIGAQDPLTFSLVAFTLAAAALLATWLPARRASRIDPLLALREE